MLLRHPCAVANSRSTLGWDSHLDDFLAQHELVNDFLGPLRKEMENAETLFEQQVFMWCVENYIPLKQFNENEILVVFYEHLNRNPQVEIERIMGFLGKSFSPDLLAKVSKPSTESRKDSAIISGDDPISSWRKSVSDQQVKKAVEILSLFGMHKIYNEGDLPVVDGSEALNVFSA